MAEEKSAAQNKLGELFVDIGVGGLGKFLKGMNSVSATFLLGKNAAEQFTKPIIDLSKNAGKGIVGFEKINSVTGLTISQLQELSLWSKKNNIDFNGFISQVSGLQQNLLNIAMGKGGNIKGFSLLGIDPRSLDYTKPLEALDKVKQRVLQLDEATATLALTELGLDSSLLYAWKKEKNRIDEKLLLNEKEIQSIQRQNDAWNNLGVTWEAVTTKLIARFPIIATWVDKIAEKLSNLPNLVNSFKNSWDDGSFWERLGAKILDNTFGIVNKIHLNELDKKIKEQEDVKQYAIKRALEIKPDSEKNIKLREIYVTKAEETNKKLKAYKKKREEYLPKNIDLYEAHHRRTGKPDASNEKIENTTLLSSTPINEKDIPNYSASKVIPAYLDNTVPQSMVMSPSQMGNTSINNGNYTLNFDIQQNISGNNPEQIANASASAFEDVALETIQRMNIPNM